MLFYRTYDRTETGRFIRTNVERVELDPSVVLVREEGKLVVKVDDKYVENLNREERDKHARQVLDMTLKLSRLTGRMKMAFLTSVAFAAISFGTFLFAILK